MKTIYTSLPIYNRIEKQAFERGKKGGFNTPTPIICPRHRLPSFQWKDESDGAASISDIELMNSDGVYSGNLITTLTNGTPPNDYDSLVVVGTSVDAQDASPNEVYFESDTFSVTAGELIFLRYTYDWVGDQHPYISIRKGDGTLLSTDVITSPASDGAKVRGIIILASASDARLHVRNTIHGNFEMNNIIISRAYVSFPTMPAISDDYFSYNGDTLNYLLPEGTFYLKITTDNGYVYYSDWFRVDCVYKNLINTLTNSDYETFNSSGTTILSAINSAGDGMAYSDTFQVTKDESIFIIFFLILNSGIAPTIYIANSGWTLSDSQLAIAGLNVIELIPTWEGESTIRLLNTATSSSFNTSEILVIRQFSSKYLKIDFSNTCDLGDILYQDGFTQTIWFESETMETIFPQEDEGVKDGNAKFIRSFARQVKTYIARTMLMPDFMVEVFNRMKLHDSIELTNLVGDENEVFNLEVEHEWFENDKYYAVITLTFDYDEVFVIAGCCNNM